MGRFPTQASFCNLNTRTSLWLGRCLGQESPSGDVCVCTTQALSPAWPMASAQYNLVFGYVGFIYFFLGEGYLLVYLKVTRDLDPWSLKEKKRENWPWFLLQALQ